MTDDHVALERYIHTNSQFIFHYQLLTYFAFCCATFRIISAKLVTCVTDFQIFIVLILISPSTIFSFVDTRDDDV